MNKIQVRTLITCALLCVALVFSIVFIAFEADHDCIGEHCHVCMEIQACVSFLGNIACAFVFVFVFSTFVRPLVYLCKNTESENRTPTPVMLKVKLTN